MTLTTLLLWANFEKEHRIGHFIYIEITKEPLLAQRSIYARVPQNRIILRLRKRRNLNFSSISHKNSQSRFLYTAFFFPVNYRETDHSKFKKMIEIIAGWVLRVSVIQSNGIKPEASKNSLGRLKATNSNMVYDLTIKLSLIPCSPLLLSGLYLSCAYQWYKFLA